MSKGRMVGVICLCIILFVSSQCLEAAGKKNPYERAIAVARTEIWKDINSGKCGSAVAAIMVEGRTVYAEGFGMADREKSIPVTRKTIFNIGSISKVYVATAIMLLVDDGKVSLDKPVTDYLKEFRMVDDRYKKITVRMTLNHVSGLPGTEGSNSFGFRYDDKVKKETIDTLARAHLKHDPGAMPVYCNDGFTLAEMIVERVSGMTYMKFLEQRIFTPLGLKNTSLGVGEIKDKPIAFYYDPKTGKKHPPETLSVIGAGGLASTAEELCRFMEVFSPKGKLLKEASLGEMRKEQPSKLKGKLRKPTISLGLGWDMTGLPRYDAVGLQVLGKSGGTGNYSSMVYTVPKKRISVAVIGAGQGSRAMKIALDILEATLVEKKLIAKEEKVVSIPPEPQKLPPDHVAYSGYYASGSALGQAVFDAEKNTATLFLFKGQEKSPINMLIYNNGYYYDKDGGCFYFISLDGESYFISSPLNFGIDMISMQKIKPIDKPKGLRIDMDEKVWLRRNVASEEGIMAVESHFTRSLLYKALPGYVFFGGVKRIDSAEFAGMPFDAIRDQSELTLFEHKGMTWAWVSDLLYSPRETASALKAGENSVKIGNDRYNQWLVAEEDLVIRMVRPAKGRVIIFTPNDETTYDSAVDTGDAFAAKGSYIECAGAAGDEFIVKAHRR